MMDYQRAFSGVARLLGGGRAWTAPIGIDVQARWVRVVQTRDDGAGHTIAHAAERLLDCDTPGSPEWWSMVEGAIKNLLAESGAKASSVVLTAPSFNSMSKMLELAPMPADELAAAASWQLAKELNCPASDMTCGTIKMREANAKKVNVTAFGSLSRDLMKLTAIVEKHGLTPIAIEPSAVAIARGLTCAQRSDDGVAAVIEFDDRDVQIFFVDKGDVGCIRRLPHGLKKRAAGPPEVRLDHGDAEETAEAFVDAPANEPSHDAEADEADGTQSGILSARQIEVVGQEVARQLVIAARYHMSRSNSGWPTCGVLVIPPSMAALEGALEEHSGIDFGQKPELPGLPQQDTSTLGASGWLAALGAALHDPNEQTNAETEEAAA